METGIKSSFIPKASITPERAGTRRGKSGFDFFILISLVMFVASATLAVAVFLYSQYLTTSAKSKLDQLERAKQAFEPSLIQDLTRLDDRMRAADTILEAHVAPTTLFLLLEQLTLQTVAFSSFDFTKGSDDITLTMKGVAESVNSIALQADLLSKSGIIFNPIFSNINRQVSGVNFDFSAAVNASALSYAARVSAESPLTPSEEVPVSPFGTQSGAAE